MAVKPAIINVMERAARKAARGLLHDFGEIEQLQVSKKGPADFVSAADLKAEEVLRRELSRARPDFAMVLEEQGALEPAEATERWIVDPLDGTTNFLHGLPHFAISIALESNGQIVAGCILEPLRDELFWAERGQGAFVNDQRLRVSARTQLGEALIATGLPFKGRKTHPRYLHSLQAIMSRVAGIRRFGSAALDLAYVAAGRYDGFWEFGLAPWDIAAGTIIVREAGGFVTGIDPGEEPFAEGNVLAANVSLHPELQRLLNAALAGDG